MAVFSNQRFCYILSQKKKKKKKEKKRKKDKGK